MKKLAIALILLSTGLTFSFSAAPQKEISRIQVSASTIASLPPGKTYVPDLSRSGTIYELPAGIDRSRLTSSTQRIRNYRDSLTEAPLPEPYLEMLWNFGAGV